MSQQYREYKRRKKRHERVKNIAACLMVAVISLLLCYVILERAVALHQINQDSLQKYTGSYSYKVIRQSRASKAVYIFTLENGVELEVRKAACENESLIGQCEELTFQYSSIQCNPLMGSYTAQSITTPDGATIIRNIDSSLRGNVGVIWIYSILLSILLLILGLYVYFDVRRNG